MSHERDERLDRAIAALRAATESTAAAPATRAAILTALEPRRRPMRLRLIVALAAMLTSSLALAWMRRERRIRVVDPATLSTLATAARPRAPSARSSPTPSPTALSSPTPGPTALSSPTPGPTALSTPGPTALSSPTPGPTALSSPGPTALSSPTPGPTALSSPSPTSAPAGPRALRAGRPDPAPPAAPAPPAEPPPTEPTTTPDAIAAPPADDPELADYRAAHRAHFIARDAARALAGWDRYLARWPSGRMAPEARYNRAIALFRLDRLDDAARALGPIAEQRGYRQSAARALLAEIERRRAR